MCTLNAKNCLWISDWGPHWNPVPASSCKMLSWSHILWTQYRINPVLPEHSLLPNSCRPVNTSLCLYCIVLVRLCLYLSNLDYYYSPSQNWTHARIILPKPSMRGCNYCVTIADQWVVSRSYLCCFQVNLQWLVERPSRNLFPFLYWGNMPFSRWWSLHLPENLGEFEDRVCASCEGHWWHFLGVWGGVGGYQQ